MKHPLYSPNTVVSKNPNLVHLLACRGFFFKLAAVSNSQWLPYFQTFQHYFKQINLSSEEGVDAETVNKTTVFYMTSSTRGHKQRLDWPHVYEPHCNEYGQ